VGSLSLTSDRSAIGLDIGAGHIRVAHVKQTGSGYMLASYGRGDVPPDAVVDGEVRDAAVVSAAIKDLWRKAGIRGKNVCVGVANQRVVVRLIDLPYMERAELQSAIQYQAQDYIPMALEDSIIDFDIIGDYAASSGERMMEVLLVAAHREMIQGVVAAIEGAGLRLDRVDVSSFAIVRALMGMTPTVLGDVEEQATAVVNMASDVTNIAVVERGVPRFNRISSLAGNSFTQAVAAALDTDVASAARNKALVGLPDMMTGEAAEAPDVSPDDAHLAHTALEREANKFIAEVRRSLDYYLTQTSRVRSIGQILLSGSAAQLRNFPEYLAKSVQTPVQLATPLERIQVASGASQAVTADSLGCATAIGLALGGLPS